jgi:hypothetical protein
LCGRRIQCQITEIGWKPNRQLKNAACGAWISVRVRGAGAKSSRLVGTPHAMGSAQQVAAALPPHGPGRSLLPAPPLLPRASVGEGGGGAGQPRSLVVFAQWCPPLRRGPTRGRAAPCLRPQPRPLLTAPILLKSSGTAGRLCKGGTPPLTGCAGSSLVPHSRPLHSVGGACSARALPCPRSGDFLAAACWDS